MSAIIQIAMKKQSRKVLTTKKIKHFQVAAMAVHLLGGANRAIDTEDAAVKCYELAPNLFGWQKYKEQINLELVRVSLSDAKKPKNGGLLSGSGREGWRMTANGLEWAASEKLDAKARSALAQAETRAGSIDKVRREREKSRILSSKAWQEWCDSSAISLHAAREVLRINEYTDAKMLGIKVARLRSLFQGDAEMSKFLLEVAHIVQQEKEDE
jgi:hypothetical protein